MRRGAFLVPLARALAVALPLLLTSCAGSNPDAADLPHAPDVDLPGVDTSSLTPREKHEFSDFVRQLPSPCNDVAVPVGQCVLEKRACARCLLAAQLVAKTVRDGMSHDQIEDTYRHRFDVAYVKSIPLDGSPSRGPENAPVVLVEFADFECPACARMAPILDAVWEKHQKDLRMVYKFMPLSIHAHAEIAARAGAAAFEEGRFWDMHKKLFANRDRLEEQDLDQYARDIGLDLARFRADAESAATTALLARDRKLADDLSVKQTPTIYINGREYDWHGDVEDWIDTELLH
jgi:protein-disulfide isomerase